MSKANPEIKRQGIAIAIAVVLGIVGISYAAVSWLNSGKQKPSNVSPVAANVKGNPTPESEHYSNVLNRYNESNATEAAQNGGTYLSVLSNRPASVPDAQSEPQFPAQSNTSRQPGDVPAAQQNQPRDEQDRQRERDEQLKGLMANWATKGHTVARVSTDFSATAPAPQLLAPVQISANAGVGKAAAQVTKIVPDFAITPAILKTEIDTDENSMVTAEIHTGQFAGAKVYAMGYKRLGETVDMTFTFMEWNGRSYKITAKPIDPKTRRTGLSGNVNSRYFERIILPAIVGGIGRTGQLYEQSAAQNIITSQGAVIQTYPETPNAKAVAGTIVGGMGNQAGQVLAADAASLPQKQVIVPADTTIGIQFVGPVLSTDDTAPSAQAVAEDMAAIGQPSPQPQRQQTFPTNVQQQQATPNVYVPQQQYFNPAATLGR